MNGIIILYKRDECVVLCVCSEFAVPTVIYTCIVQRRMHRKIGTAQTKFYSIPEVQHIGSGSMRNIKKQVCFTPFAIQMHARSHSHWWEIIFALVIGKIHGPRWAKLTHRNTNGMEHAVSICHCTSRARTHARVCEWGYARAVNEYQLNKC